VRPSRWRDLENEVIQLSDKLAVRKIIERAKGIVQSEFNMSEEEAYSLIKKQARSRRKSMKEIAEAILVTNDIKRIQKPAPSADELAS
jgi:uroporphyrinogen-III synthase